MPSFKSGGNTQNAVDNALEDKYSYFQITAEENADLTNGAHEWAFGNGNETPSGMGVIIPFECELFFLGLTTEGIATCEVEAKKNTSSSGSSVSTNNERKAFNDFSDNPVIYNQGDVFGFRTITGDAASNGGVATAWFRKSLSSGRSSTA